MVPHAADGEDVVVRSQRHEQHGRGERDVEGELSGAEQTLEDQHRHTEGRAQCQHARGQQCERGQQRAQEQHEHEQVGGQGGHADPPQVVGRVLHDEGGQRCVPGQPRWRLQADVGEQGGQPVAQRPQVGNGPGAQSG